MNADKDKPFPMDCFENRHKRAKTLTQTVLSSDGLLGFLSLRRRPEGNCKAKNLLKAIRAIALVGNHCSANLAKGILYLLLGGIAGGFLWSEGLENNGTRILAQENSIHQTESLEKLPAPVAYPSKRPSPENAGQGKLAILGIRSQDQIQRLTCPDDSFLVQIPAASSRSAKKAASSVEEGAGNQENQAGLKNKVQGTSRDSEETEGIAYSDQLFEIPNDPPRYFVCQINRLSPEERALFADAGDGKWDSISFLDAILIAEGLSESEIVLCRQIYDRRLEELKAEIADQKDANDLTKIRLVFEYLHRHILTGTYDLNHSSAAVSLQTGGFNCVSATTLFNALAGDVGLSPYGLEMTGHAKSRIQFGDQYLDVETTCPKWELLPDKPVSLAQTMTVARPVQDSPSSFRAEGASQPSAAFDLPDTDPFDEEASSDSIASSSHIAPTSFDEPEFHSDGPVTQERAVKMKSRRDMRAVTPVQFVATIYYNRAVDYYQAKEFDSAIASYLKAIALDPENKTVLGNLKATLNNLAIELVAQKKNYAQAIQITEQGLALDPDFDQFKANLPLYYKHWSEDLRKKNRPEEARIVEARYQERLPHSAGKIF